MSGSHRPKGNVFFSIIALMIIQIASTSIFFQEYDSNTEFPPSLMEGALHIIQDMSARDKGGREMPPYHVELFANNDLKNLYIQARVFNDEYNSKRGFCGGNGDVFRLLFECHSCENEDTSPYTYEDGKLVATGPPDDSEKYMRGHLADEQFHTMRDPRPPNTAMGQTAMFVGTPDQSVGGTVNFRASVSHTNPFEGKIGNYTANFVIPLKGEWYHNEPIDLFANPGDNIGIAFIFVDPDHYCCAGLDFNYTVR